MISSSIFDQSPSSRIISRISFSSSLIACTFSLIICRSSSFCAFGFSRCDFKGKETIFMILFSTVMLPGAVTQVPMFVFYARLNMVNTLFPFTGEYLLDDKKRFFTRSPIDDNALRQIYEGITP